MASTASTALPSADLRALKDAFLNWCAQKGQKHISVLITGKTGVGKSRLVNALVGKQVAVEGRSKDPCTSTVTSHNIIIQDVQIHIWDSPGLQDGTSNEELYLEDLEKKLRRGMDVMIYCLKMDDRRFHEDDKRAIRTLTTTFGNKLWKNAVIALTFANNVKDPDARDKEDKRAYFMRDLACWREAIEVFFTRDLKIDFELFQAIPIVPTGNYRKLQLPNCENWLSELWTQCYCVMKDGAALNLYRINKERVKFPGSEKMAAACSCSCGHSAPAYPPPTHTTVVTTQGTNVNSTPSTSSGANSTPEIPREIPLNLQQQESFWKKTWNAFKEVCKFVGTVVLGALSHVALKLIFPFVPF